VRELRIPVKARNAFEKGLERLTKNDAIGSRAQFVRATTAFPDYYEAYYHIGVADLRLGREEEAAQAFQTAIDLSGGRYAWAQFALGLLLCRRGEYAEAETVIRKGLDVDGSPATGHLFLSVALFRLNRLEEAQKSAREALLKKPGFALAYLVLADVHGRRGEYARQLRTWTRTSNLRLTDRQASGFARFAKSFGESCSERKMRNDSASSGARSGSGLRWRIEGKDMVKVKSSQKIFTETEIASLTGICVEHLHSLARTRRLGFIARAAEVAGKQADQWLFYAVGPDGPRDAVSWMQALSCASSRTVSGSGYAIRHASGVYPYD